jgi:hypothetical protein
MIIIVISGTAAPASPIAGDDDDRGRGSMMIMIILFPESVLMSWYGRTAADADGDHGNDLRLKPWRRASQGGVNRAFGADAERVENGR